MHPSGGASAARHFGAEYDAYYKRTWLAGPGNLLKREGPRDQSGLLRTRHHVFLEFPVAVSRLTTKVPALPDLYALSSNQTNASLGREREFEDVEASPKLFRACSTQSRRRCRRQNDVAPGADPIHMAMAV